MAFSQLNAEVLEPRCVPHPMGLLYALSINHVLIGLGCCGLTLARYQAPTKAAHSLPSATGQRGENKIKGSRVEIMTGRDGSLNTIKGKMVSIERYKVN